MDVYEKLRILADAAKYDVACTSSGVERVSGADGLGSASTCGICHAFSGDGRCISILKILMSNDCAYDCTYCVNRQSNDTPRATFTPEEIATLTIEFYRRNYIEGLFLSSGVLLNPTETTERMTAAVRLLREKYRFYGYIHVKAIPGASPESVRALGLLADRMSVNIELPSEAGLRTLAPQKTKETILRPMELIRSGIEENRRDLTVYRHAPKFVPAGQSTQIIVGATKDSDLQIMRLTEALYKRYSLKRVFFSAYVPVVENSLLPAITTEPPLLREHRLYQADWLLRYYGFSAGELLSEERPNFSEYFDPKCDWAIAHPEFFPVELTSASYEEILRVPGIGVLSAKRIVVARRSGLTFPGLARMGVVLKRAKYFVTVYGRRHEGGFDKTRVFADLAGATVVGKMKKTSCEQLNFFTELGL